MLGFLNPQDKDALTLEKERLNKHLLSLQKQSQELEKLLQKQCPQASIPQKKVEARPERIARFIPDEEISQPLPLNKMALKTDLLKHQKRITKNRVITMAIVAFVLIILVIRTLF